MNAVQRPVAPPRHRLINREIDLGNGRWDWHPTRCLRALTFSLKIEPDGTNEGRVTVRHGHSRPQPRHGRRRQTGEGAGARLRHGRGMPSRPTAADIRPQRHRKDRKVVHQVVFPPEAVSRVAALWRSREHLRLDPATGMSVWWRDHADHHMAVLLNPQGPFYNCDMKEHRDPDHLEPRKAPAGWFPDERRNTPTP